MTENEAIKRLQTLNIILTNKSGHKEDGIEKIFTFLDITAICKAIQALEEVQAYRAIGTPTQIYEKIGGLDVELGKYASIGTIEEFKALKEKDNKDFESLLKAVKESYPMFKGAYVEFDVFMGDVMRRFTKDRKET